MSKLAIYQPTTLSSAAITTFHVLTIFPVGLILSLTEIGTTHLPGFAHGATFRMATISIMEV